MVVDHKGVVSESWNICHKQTTKFDYLDEDFVFKYIDDVTILEIVSLLSIGLDSHNAKLQVPSHISQYITCSMQQKI